MEKEKYVTSETVKEMDEAGEREGLRKLEAALFLSAKFLTLQELVMLTGINPLMLKELLEKLIEKYNKKDSAIEIVSKGNMWKMDVRQEYVHMINKLATGNAEFSKTEQETLAVIAYKQPVKQSVIVKIRGNKAYEHIKKFIENGLVIGKKMGHTKELKLSDDFYEYFHLRNKGLEKIDNKTDEDTNKKLIISKEQSDKENSLSDEQKNNNEDNTNLEKNNVGDSGGVEEIEEEETK